jgi:hypothetical protein
MNAGITCAMLGVLGSKLDDIAEPNKKTFSK